MMMLWGLLPYAVGQVYASTLRETGETVVPMKAGIIAIAVNLCFNYVLIFGRLGSPTMGVEGAALATVISRYVECAIIIVWTHAHKHEHPFIKGAYRSLRVPASLTVNMLKKGMPLLVNEFLWSSAMATLTQCYSTRGLAVVAGLNICTTISNLFNAVWLSMGTVVAIMVGQQLGANEFDRVKQTVRRLIAVSVSGATGLALLMCAAAPFFPLMYNTTQEVRSLATRLLIIVALSGPLHAFCHACYFTLRSGGKTLITFLFDSAYMWVVSIPLAWALSSGTTLPILPIYAACQFIDFTKCFLGAYLLKKGVWINNIVNTQ
jgi:putative MATE family efflux protein